MVKSKKKKITIIVLTIILLLCVIGLTLFLVLRDKSHHHSYEEWRVTKIATCTETGQRERICKSCNHIEIEIITKLPHTPTNELHQVLENHFHICSACGNHVNINEHIFNLDNKCTICDYELEYTKNLVYSVSNNTYIVTSLENVENGTTKLIIPAYHEGIKVTGIASNLAMTNQTIALNITYVFLPNTFTKLSNSTLRSFGSLTDVYLPETITEIENSAFENCSSLTKIDLPINLTKIGERTFFECSGLINIIIPNTVKTIGTSAFQRCINLKQVSLPNELNVIEENTFRGCKNLNAITIPASVTKIKDGAFIDCQIIEVRNLSSSLKIETGRSDYGAIAVNALKVLNNSSEQSGITETAFGFVFFNDNGKYLLINYNGAEKSITLPESFNGQPYSIHKYAFYDKVITSLNMNGKLVTIEENAFLNCLRLTTITIKNVEHIESNAFQNCGNLRTVVLGEKVNNIDNLAFNSTRATYYLELEEIPASWHENWNNGNVNVLLKSEWEYVDGKPSKIQN